MAEWTKKGDVRQMEEMDKVEFKCVMLGPPGVGKTCLFNRLSKGHFLDCPLSTISSAAFRKTLTLTGGAVVIMDLWDTGGLERYRSLTLSYYRDAKAVLLAYDADSKSKIGDWLKEVSLHLSHNQALVFLVGTKLDLGSDVALTEAEVQALGKGGGVGVEGHFVLSAKTGENVEETFNRLAESVWRAWKEIRVDLGGRKGTVKIGDRGGAQGVEGSSKSSSKCCGGKRDAAQ